MCFYCLPNFSVILFLFRLQVSKNFWAIFVVAWIVSSSANFYSLVSGTVRKVPPWTNHLSDGTSNAFLCSSLLLLIARSLPQEALWFYLPPTHPFIINTAHRSQFDSRVCNSSLLLLALILNLSQTWPVAVPPGCPLCSVLSTCPNLSKKI